jgi:hypothetical protein
MPASSAHRLKSSQIAMPPQWSADRIRKALDGAPAVEGSLSAETIAAMWSPKAYEKAGRFSAHSSQHWPENAAAFLALAQRAAPASVVAFAPTDQAVLWMSGALADPDVDLFLSAPKNAMSTVILAPRHNANGDSNPLSGAPGTPVSLFSVARRRFSAPQTRRLEKAFAERRLSVLACVATDYWAEDLPAQLKASHFAEGSQPPGFFAPNRNAPDARSAAIEWLASRMVSERSVRGGLAAASRWVLFVARALVAQSPEEGKLIVGEAFTRALGYFRYEGAPKKTAPGPLTLQETTFCALARRIHDFGKAFGHRGPAALDAAMEAVVAREASAKKAAEQDESLPALDAKALKGRQNVLLAAVDNLDMETISWLLGPGGMRGQRLIFSRGVSRGGVADSLMNYSRFRDSKVEAKAARALDALVAAGFDFLLEAKAQGGKKWANPIERGAHLAAHGRPGPLLTAFAHGQIRSCEQAGMDIGEVEAWTREAKANSAVAKLLQSGRAQGYFEALGVAVERLLIGAAVADARAEQAASADSAEAREAGALASAPAPKSSRRGARL